MPTFTVTRCIEIQAPVEQVFTFISDPCRRMLAMSRGYERREAVSDLEASPDGIVTRYKVTTGFFRLPFNTTIPMIRAEHVANERILGKALVVNRDVDDFTLEASGRGARLTWRYELTTPHARVKILGLLSAKGKTSQERQMDDNLARPSWSSRARPSLPETDTHPGTSQGSTGRTASGSVHPGGKDADRPRAPRVARLAAQRGRSNLGVVTLVWRQGRVACVTGSRAVNRF